MAGVLGRGTLVGAKEVRRGTPPAGSPGRLPSLLLMLLVRWRPCGSRRIAWSRLASTGLRAIGALISLLRRAGGAGASPGT